MSCARHRRSDRGDRRLRSGPWRPVPSIARSRLAAPGTASSPATEQPGPVVGDWIIGRDAELEIAAAAVRELRDGRPTALTIEGEAGIGKSCLVDHIVADAQPRDVAVLRGQAHPFERSRPFGVIAAALGITRRSTDPRTVRIDALLRREAAAPDAGDVRYQVVEEMVDLVESSCAVRPVLLVVEDLHWADTGSLLAISSMVRQLTLSPLMVLATTRPAPLPAETALLLDDLTAAGARVMLLPPLTPDQVAVLAGHELDGDPGPTLTELLARAGGNPMWVSSIVAALAEEGLLARRGLVVDATTMELPESLHDLVVRRLRHLSKPTRDLLQVAAVLGDSVSLRDVAAVAHRSPAEVVGQLADAFEAQLLDESDGRVVFRHQLVHDAIYHHVPEPARRVLHREAAVALTDAGVDRIAVADHLMLGAEPGDEMAIAALRAAAHDASASSPSVAVELVRRAEALLPAGHPETDQVALEVVAALLRVGNVAEASARAESVLARPHAVAVGVPIRLALLGALALQNRAAEVIAVADAGLAGPVSLGAAERVSMLAQQSWALTYTGDHRAGEAVARRALDMAEAADDAAGTGLALTALMVAEGRHGRFGDALAHARRADDLAARSSGGSLVPLRSKLFLGLSLFDCDLVADARMAYRAALDDEAGPGWWLSDTLMADALVSFALGDWDDAVPRLLAGGEAAEQKDHPLLLSQSRAYRAVIATAVGDHHTALECTAGFAEALAIDAPIYNAGVLAFALAEYLVATDDPRGAYAVLLACWRRDARTENRYSHRSLAPDLVRLALALDERAVADEVVDAVAVDAQLAPEVATVRSVALRCQGLVAGDPEPLIEAVALARTVPLLMEHAGACEDAATVLRVTTHRSTARAMLTEALERYEHAGADAWAGRVRARLRDLGFRPAPRGRRRRPTHGWESLTETERAVSRLVAEGLTNGAVARRLYISPHTVNTHLRHVFAKLDISNRVELAGVVHSSIE